MFKTWTLLRYKNLLRGASKEEEKLFDFLALDWQISSSSLTLQVSPPTGLGRPPLRGGCQERGVVVRWKRLRCTRLQHRTCKTSRGNFVSHGLSAHGLSTERARLAGGTSLRSWVQKKCLLPGEILIFFSKKSPILKIQVGFFSTYKSF